jgi:hypothetical protein
MTGWVAENLRIRLAKFENFGWIFETETVRATHFESVLCVCPFCFLFVWRLLHDIQLVLEGEGCHLRDFIGVTFRGVV